jgi:hypothetical protein
LGEAAPFGQVGRAHLEPEEGKSLLSSTFLSARSNSDMSASPGGWKPMNSKSLTVSRDFRASLQIGITEVGRKTQRSETDEGKDSGPRKALKFFERGVDGKGKLTSFGG